MDELSGMKHHAQAKDRSTQGIVNQKTDWSFKNQYRCYWYSSYYWSHRDVLYDAADLFSVKLRRNINFPSQIAVILCFCVRSDNRKLILQNKSVGKGMLAVPIKPILPVRLRQLLKPIWKSAISLKDLMHRLRTEVHRVLLIKKQIGSSLRTMPFFVSSI